MAVNGVSLQQALQARQDLELSQQMRNSFLSNPAISGFTEQQLSRNLQLAFGGNSASTLGGIGLDTLASFGVTGLSGQNELAGILGNRNFNDIVSAGLSLAGPDSVASQLMKKANMAAISETQTKLPQIQAQLAQLGNIQQYIATRQRLGIGLNPNEQVAIQTALSQITEPIAQFQRDQEMYKLLGIGSLNGLGGGINPLASPSSGLGGFSTSNFGGFGVPVSPVPQQQPSSGFNPMQFLSMFALLSRLFQK